MFIESELASLQEHHSIFRWFLCAMKVCSLSLNRACMDSSAKAGEDTVEPETQAEDPPILGCRMPL
jgi:hypothetical protein